SFMVIPLSLGCEAALSRAGASRACEATRGLAPFRGGDDLYCRREACTPLGVSGALAPGAGGGNRRAGPGPLAGIGEAKPTMIGCAALPALAGAQTAQLCAPRMRPEKGGRHARGRGSAAGRHFKSCSSVDLHENDGSVLERHG